jgi:hypothetical protein
MEIVKPIDWHPKWDGGAPMPQVFSNGHKVYVIYFIADWDKDRLGEIKTTNPIFADSQLVALVEFNGHTFRFGIANDEVFQGLPLYKEGLSEWAHIIENSKWIEEIKQIHKVHPYFNPFKWTKLNHYAFLFKDEMLEVIAADYKIEVYRTTYQDIGVEILNRMNK